MTGEEIVILAHPEREVGYFLNGGLVGFALAVKVRICVYGDLGVFLNAIKKIFEGGLVFKIIKFSRNPADKEFSFIAVGRGYPNMREQKSHHIPPIVMPSDMRRSSNSSWLSMK